MKLITKEIEKRIENTPLYSQDGKGKLAKVICKFFVGPATWLVLEGRKEASGDILFYGLTDLGYGFEYGYFTLSQLMKVRGPFGLPVERDMYFKPCELRSLNIELA